MFSKCVRRPKLATVQIEDISSVRDDVERHFQEFSSKGFRTLGIAYKDVGPESTIGSDQETGMTFLGFLVLFDPPKADIAETIGLLKRLGVSLKIITGDNRLVAANLSQQIGLPKRHDPDRSRTQGDE